MKIPLTNIELFGRSEKPSLEVLAKAIPAGAPTGAMLRSSVATPEGTKVIHEMLALSASLSRNATQHNDRLGRGFDAAVTNDWNQDFKGTYASANTEIFTNYYTIWARARSIAQNMPHGKAIVRAYQNNVVGHDPFKISVRMGKMEKKPGAKGTKPVRVFTADHDKNNVIEKEWRQFIKPKNFTIRRTISFMEGFRMLAAECVTIGSGIVRLWDGFPGNKYRFAVDFLESDRLQPNYHGEYNGNPIRASVEYDKTWNYPVAYWLLKRHPGEYVVSQFMNPPGGNDQANLRERVPAEDIIHLNALRDRAEQDLGFTQIEACVQSIYMNYKYAGALTICSLAACCKPWVIEKNTPTGMSFTPTAEEFGALISRADEQGNNSLAAQGLSGKDTAGTQKQLFLNRELLSPAMTKVLDWGYTMKVLDPKFPVEAAHEFRTDNNHEIATAAGVSYQEMTGVFESLGYIAAQMSQQPARNNYMAWQKNFADVAVERIFERWLRSTITTTNVFEDRGVNISITEVDDICESINITPKRWPFTDALREVQALVLKKDARLISPQQAQDEMPDGVDIEELTAQLAEAQECEEAHGLLPLGVTPMDVLATEEEDEDAASLSKTNVPKGSKTAKGQKPETT